VGATTSTDARASYSNIGTCLDLFAPGSSITSAWYTSPTATNTISGTSMASPHVAGAVAALLESAPGSTPGTVAATITGTATPGVVSSAGTGSPNLLLYADPTLVPAGTATPPPPVTATTPSAPTNVVATARSASAGLTWTVGADGGSALTGQTVSVYKYARNGKATLSGTVVVTTSATSVIVTGLRTGTTYSFTVSATNAIGTSPASAMSNKVTAT
ncbi:MAG: S8 family serine peptidase, partial [Frankiales bacterium]|nr:S8 family serine peptidase [Frankiales bacterium]